MNPIDDLIAEHAPIRLLLRVMEKINEKISEGELVSSADLDGAVVFLREFADKYHHGREENLLFPLLRKNNIQKEVELVDTLTAEHVEGRGYVRNMADAISKKEVDPGGFAEIFVANSKKYIALLDRHIDKENRILFPEAKTSLSGGQLEELQSGFENLEKNMPARQKELLDIMKQLKEAYL